MAYIRPVKTGYRAEVEKLGIRRSQTFDTKAEARNWGAAEEAAILAQARNVDQLGVHSKPLGDVMDEYGLRFSSKKNGGDWEILRIEAFKRNFPKLASKPMHETTTADWSLWRDKRLETVSGSTVVRELNLWSAIYQKSMHELGPYCKGSPFTRLEKPKENPARTARWGWTLVKFVVRRLGYVTGKAPETKSQEVAYAILIALRTAMRAQEVLSLSDDNVNLDTRVAVVNHKMQYATGAPRKVPMQKQAARLIRVIQREGLYFSLTPKQLDGLWRKHRDKMLVTGVTFHDTRAEAITRLSRKVDVLTLSAISGIKDLDLLNERYYRERAEEIAARI